MAVGVLVVARAGPRELICVPLLVPISSLPATGRTASLALLASGKTKAHGADVPIPAVARGP